MYCEIVGRFAVGQSNAPPPEPPPGKTRVKPELYWDQDSEKLSYTVPAYDPDSAVPPAQLVVVLLPSGHDLGATADALYAATAVPKSVTAIAEAPAGVADTVLTIPDRDPDVAYAGFVVAAWTD